MRQTFLETDFITSNSLATTYDADLENFWTQKSNYKRQFINVPVFLLFFPVKYLIKISKNLINYKITSK